MYSAPRAKRLVSAMEARVRQRIGRLHARGVTLLACGLTMGIAAAVSFAAPTVTPAGCVDDLDSGWDLCARTARGLGTPTAAAVSPDGKSVYVTGSGDDAIVRFTRNTTTGVLTSAGCVDDNDTGSDTCAQTTNGLDAAVSVAVSPDGKSVYAAAFEDDAIVRFNRDTTTGALTPAGCVDDNDSGADACAQKVDGLDGAGSVAVSPNGKSVYVSSFFDEAVVRFNRNTTSGALTPAGCVDDNDSGPETCAQSTNGLAGAYSVNAGQNGSVYAVSFSDSAIVRFNRNPTSGVLTPAGCVDDSDYGYDACAQNTRGLFGAASSAVSADGKSLYAASIADSAIVRFNRNTTSGALTPAGCMDDNDSGPDVCAQTTNGLWGADSVAVSQDGQSVYAAGFNDDAIVAMNRNVTTGAIAAAGCIDDDDTGADACARSTHGLYQANAVVLSANGKSLYAVSNGDSAVVRLNRVTN